MNSTFDQIRELVQKGSVRISDHGYDELAADGILAREAIEGITSAILVEDYPNYPKGSAYWYAKQITKGDLFTSFGAYQKARPNRQY